MEKPNISDKITEVYFDTSGKKGYEEYRDRVHWICKNTKGNTALDVGCSQGIVSILLAREGIKVLGIDSDEKTINYAKEFFKDERSETLENITFEKCNFMTRDFNEKYDTVVCTEVLEHLVRPTRFIQKISDLLNEDGVAIFTVPFGINEYFDHKKTYYIYELIEEISEFLSIKEFEFVHGKWVGVICEKKKADKQNIDHYNKALVLKLEEAFNRKERNYITDIKAHLNTISYKDKKMNEIITTYKSQIAEFEIKLKQSNSEIAKNNSQLADAQNQIDELNKKFAEMSSEFKKSLLSEKELLLECQKLSSECQKLSTQNKNLSREYDNLKQSKFGKLQVKYWDKKKK